MFRDFNKTNIYVTCIIHNMSLFRIPFNMTFNVSANMKQSVHNTVLVELVFFFINKSKNISYNMQSRFYRKANFMLRTFWATMPPNATIYYKTSINHTCFCYFQSSSGDSRYPLK